MGHGSEDGLVDLAMRARAFLEPLWIGFLCDPWGSACVPLSTGACRVSSEFLGCILPEHGYEGWAVHGGEGAFTDADGVARDHFWLSDGGTILDITADQFGLPAIVTGVAYAAQYRPGRAKPLSDAARSEAGCIERWLDAWRLTGGVATPSPVNAASMADYAGPSAGALALLLHEETGIPIHLAYAEGKPPHPVVWDGSHALDARGFTGWEFIGHVLGTEPGDLVATDPAGLRSVMGPITPSEVDAAYGFALCHPALGEALRQARYSRMPDASDEPDDEMGMDAPGFAP